MQRLVEHADRQVGGLDPAEQLAGLGREAARRCPVLLDRFDLAARGGQIVLERLGVLERLAYSVDVPEQRLQRTKRRVVPPTLLQTPADSGEPAEPVDDPRHGVTPGREGGAELFDHLVEALRLGPVVSALLMLPKAVDLVFRCQSRPFPPPQSGEIAVPLVLDGGYVLAAREPVP